MRDAPLRGLTWVQPSLSNDCHDPAFFFGDRALRVDDEAFWSAELSLSLSFSLCSFATSALYSLILLYSAELICAPKGHGSDFEHEPLT